MEKKSQSLTADEFFESLQQDKLMNAMPITLVGMVKKSEGKERTIQFAPGGNCSNWVTIPVDLIEDVEILKTVPCKDHAHPLVQLNLKTQNTPEAKIFAALFSALLQGMPSSRGMQPMPPGVGGMQPMQPTFAGRQLVDEWGDPVCGPGMRKRCYPAVCPNPSGRGTIWCTVCRCEPVFDPEPFPFAPYYGF
jgi:hypothetical protein